ncbi:prominin-2 [Alosa sapidissima]|uniref:prominin-2 n=1 Tax=Alosa sapidissima TaxID=34773 RepID=UPI001C09D55D|nr:prominin-2 [Alosa sapidissima]
MGRGLWKSGRSPAFWGCLTTTPLLLLLVCLPEPGTCQALCPSQDTPKTLSEPRYVPLPNLDLDTGFMTGIVHSFLGLVQPNPFPKDLLVRLVEDTTQITNQEMIQEMLRYEIGFLVCVAIGVLYIVLMPLVGFCFACCRCCGNCGGHMYQEQTKSITCRRRGLYWATLIITLVILAGNICMFASNESTKKSVEKTPQRLNTTLTNLNMYLTAVPEQITSVVNKSSQTVDTVSNNLNDIGPLLGREIQKGLEGPLNPALESVRSLALEVDRTSIELNHLNSSLGQLQSELAVLQANLTAVRDRINATLQKPACFGCSGLQSELEQLPVDTTLNTPDLSEFQSAVDKAQEANLESVVKEGKDFFDTIPKRVTNETKDTVQSVKNKLDSIKTQISQVTNDIPLSTLEEISQEITTAQGYVDLYSPDVENAEKYRWIVGVILCCLILLVVVCNLLGLLMGPAGLKPKADPTERSGTADCGGTFFMAGVGFSFLFSWIFMLLVLILFLVGGNSYTLICKPWRDQELYQFIDTPGLIPGFNLSESLGLKTQLTLSNIISDCNENKSLWITLHLDELIDLNEFLNVSKYTEEIRQSFENTNISISTVTLLSPDIVAQLESFSGQAESVNFNSAIDQINTFSTFGANLTTIADKLEQLADVQPDPGVEAELRQEAIDMRSISNEFNDTIKPQLQEVKSSAELLSATASQINETVGGVLQKVGAAQNFLNSNTSQIVKNESRDFLDCQLTFFTAFADWANITITQKLGQCGPVAQAVNSAETIVCTHLVESLNAFWFSLGWCMLFLIPSIILSVKLAKFYRRMKETDFFENPIPLTTFPRAAMMKPY